MATFFDPFGEINRVQREINRLFGDLSTGFGSQGMQGMQVPSGIGMVADRDVSGAPAPVADVDTTGARGGRARRRGVYEETLPWDERRDLTFAPRTDLMEHENDLVFYSELPGLTKEDIKVELRENSLHIMGERRRPDKAEDETFHYQERDFGKFHRSFKLPHKIKDDGMTASFHDGILQVRLVQDKPPAAVTKPIAIQ